MGEVPLHFIGEVPLGAFFHGRGTPGGGFLWARYPCAGGHDAGGHLLGCGELLLQRFIDLGVGVQGSGLEFKVWGS